MNRHARLLGIRVSHKFRDRELSISNDRFRQALDDVEHATAGDEYTVANAGNLFLNQYPPRKAACLLESFAD
jgi:hypothetical protein